MWRDGCVCVLGPTCCHFLTSLYCVFGFLCFCEEFCIYKPKSCLFQQGFIIWLCWQHSVEKRNTGKQRKSCQIKVKTNKNKTVSFWGAGWQMQYILQFVKVQFKSHPGSFFVSLFKLGFLFLQSKDWSERYWKHRTGSIIMSAELGWDSSVVKVWYIIHMDPWTFMCEWNTYYTELYCGSAGCKPHIKHLQLHIALYSTKAWSIWGFIINQIHRIMQWHIY